jgi:hypothetical protein
LNHFLKFTIMKKLIIILAAVLSISAASAQNRNVSYNGRDSYQATQTTGNWNDNGRGGDQAYNNNDKRNDQYNRPAVYDRTNGQYDQRDNGYRDDRSGKSYERQRRMNDGQVERQQSRGSFTTGLVVGGLAALLVGALISK